MVDLEALKAKMDQDLKDLWVHDKLFLFLFGVVILAWKFRTLLIDLLVSDSKQVQIKAEAKDSKLAAQETDANEQADALVEQANREASKETTVDENWNKK